MTIFSSFSTADPDRAAARRRLGVIDLGSNSVRLVVFDGATRAPEIFFNEKVLCGLGARLEAEGRLSEEGRARALAALKRFATITRHMALDKLVAVGTAALRDAADGAAFVAEAQAALGIDIHVASGADEARLAAQGVLLGDPEADGVVADLGGASLELTSLSRGVAGEGVTAPLGPLRLQAAAEAGRRDRLSAEIDARLDDAIGGRRAPGRDLHIIGGSWRAMVKAHMENARYPLRVLHGFTLKGAEAEKVARWASKLTPEQLREMAEVSERRAAVTPLAALVLYRLVKKLAPPRVTLSAYGLREGVLWEHMPPARRDGDPLLDAAAALGREMGRAPELGAALWRWLRPTLGALSARRARLAEAVCLLVDVSWRTHPDYRAQASFEVVTRNMFGGVDHEDRVFMGAALLHRYKASRRAVRNEAALELLDEAGMAEAAALGKGLRAGAAFAGAAPDALDRAPLAVAGDRLTFSLTAADRDRDGEEVRKRLAAFAAALGCSPV
ncbi:MAG: Ppx/GppA family phosphatase [Pseudomonadota bacterium]